MDVFTIRLGIVVVGTICLGSVGGIVFLEANGHAPSKALEYLVFTCVAALVGTLVNPKKD